MSNKKNDVWTLAMQTFTVEAYLKSGSYSTTMTDFEQKFDIEKALSKSTIVYWVKKFSKEGSARGLRPKTPGRRTNSGWKRAIGDEEFEMIRLNVERKPKQVNETASSRT